MGSRAKSVSGSDEPPKPPGLQYRWYKWQEFLKLLKEAQTWLIWEKKRHDKAGLGEKEREKRRIKAAVCREKRKLAKLKSKSKLDKKQVQRDQVHDLGDDAGDE